MKYDKQALYLEMESFYLVTTEDEGEDLRAIRSMMGGLVRKARKAIPEDMEVKQKIHQLLQLMYSDWGFRCDENRYFQAENLYLSYVLRSKQGMPVSLGCILLYLADKLNLPIFPVLFPTQLILRAELENETLFIDPWNGQYINQEELSKWYQGAFGFGAKLTPKVLAIAEPQELTERFAELAKNCLIREELNDAALKYIESRLSFKKWDKSFDKAYEIRDRGLVLAQMGAYHAAIEDFNYFIEKHPQDQTALLLQAQLAEIQENLKEDLLH